ncbi:MAG: hypothetical protein JNK23_16140 [Opitutaceae bacterium]|nr:hypothetical protein [Opitutaceae bacterium]
MRRTIVLFATLLLLWTLVTQLNDALAPLRVHLFAGALFVVFSALTQPRRQGLAATLLAGLVCDAHAPVAFGLHLVLFAAAHALLFHLRERVAREDAISMTVVALLTNLGLFLLLSFTQIHASPAPASAWPRLIADLAASQLLLVVATPWFTALQARALVVARVPRFDLA